MLTDIEDDCWVEGVEKVKAKIQANVENSFRMIWQQFGFGKARKRPPQKYVAAIRAVRAIQYLAGEKKRCWPDMQR